MASAVHPPPRGRIDQDLLGKAINALLKWEKSRSQAQKPQLLEGDQFIYLVLTLKRIPQKAATNASLVPLPHPLHAPPSSEICLIVGDRSGSGLTSDLAKKKIQSEDVPVSKVLKLSKLRSDFREFERKRKLCDSYDLFLTDRRVVPLLPRILGKQFFKKRKLPVPVDLRHRNWKEQVERACGSALLYLRTGTCCVLKVARASMAKQEIVENVAAAINGVAKIVPKKWANVRSFHVKLLESTALPVYQALPDVKLRIEGIKREVADEKNKQVEGTEKEEKLAEKKEKKKKQQQQHSSGLRGDDSNDNVGELGIDEGDDDVGSDKIEGDESGGDKIKRDGRGVVPVDGGGVRSNKSDGKKMKRVEKSKNAGVSKPKKRVLASEGGEVSGKLQLKKKSKLHKVGKLKLKQ